MNARRFSTVLVLLALSASCTINRTRAAGEQCLVDRECVNGLACLPTTEGPLRCQSPRDGGAVVTEDVTHSGDAEPDARLDAQPDAQSVDAQSDAQPDDAAEDGFSGG